LGQLGKATGYEMDNPGSIPGREWKFTATTSEQTLWPTSPPTKSVPRVNGMESDGDLLDLHTARRLE